MSGIYRLPPGIDFPAAVLDGLAARLADEPPEVWGRTTIFVNSGRMARRLQELFDAGPPRLLPRILPVSDIGPVAGFPDIPQAQPQLALTLALTRLIEALIARDPTLGPAAAAFDLARSLAVLIDRAAGDGVDLDRIAGLDLAEHAAHWQRSRAILDAARGYLAQQAALPGAEARRRALVDALIAHWQAAPPAAPVLVAGSTGSRRTTRRLIAAVAALDRGYVVLPGVDPFMPAEHWAALGAGGQGEDHPQARFGGLAESGTPADLPLWHDTPAPDPARNRLVSLALCPAPVTDRWRAEGAALGDPACATSGLALLEAPSPRAEAASIAVRLRRAVEDGQRAALITPDRALARQVTAALDRWGILPDESAGVPLPLSPPGRLLRMTAEAMSEAPDLPGLIGLLKHPLAVQDGTRGPHLRATRELELFLRKEGIAAPDGAALARFAARHPEHGAWADWVSDWLARAEAARMRAPLGDRIAAHCALAEALVTGTIGTSAGGTRTGGTRTGGTSTGGAPALWSEAAGEAARASMDALAEAAPAYDGPITPRAYADLIRSHLAAADVQDPRLAHPGVMIWGTLEARAGGLDLAVLGGLNDGIWPGLPPPDPWLSRAMRSAVGLPPPEREIGLAAHDFQQAIAAPEALLTRAVRDDEAETVPSRWLNRLTFLLRGLGPSGADALAAMQARGQHWLDLAHALDRPDRPDPAAPRPSPQPPLARRPAALSVTAITTLIRDPYAIYARHVLRLVPVAPLVPQADARARGIALHEVMRAFLEREAAWRDDPEAARAALVQATAALDRPDTDPAMQALWRARLMAQSERLIAAEIARLAEARPVLLESAQPGRLTLPGLGFTLTARPDRIDRFDDGTYAIRDYKTGKPPELKQVRAFEKQLPLEAAIAEAGGFPGLPAAPVAAMTYIALGASGADIDLPLTHEGHHLPSQARDDLIRLIRAYGRRSQGYTAQRAAETVRFDGDYDHLSRYGEWSLSDPAAATRVGPDDEAAP